PTHWLQTPILSGCPIRDTRSFAGGLRDLCYFLVGATSTPINSRTHVFAFAGQLNVARRRILASVGPGKKFGKGAASIARLNDLRFSSPEMNSTPRTLGPGPNEM